MPEFLDKIRSNFEGIDIDYATATLRGDYPVFIVRVNDEKTLTESWRAIISVVAVRFHGSLLDDQDFERWNTYIVFACRGLVDKGLSGLIENDKFAARKIVVQEVTDDIPNTELVEKYVTNKDLLISDISENNDAQITEFASTLPAADKSEKKRSSFASRIESSDRTNGLRELVGNDFVTSRQGANQQTKLERLLKKIEESFDENFQS